jgi:acyl carrier protein
MVFQHVSMARIRLALGVKQPVKQQQQQKRAAVPAVGTSSLKPAASRAPPTISTSTTASPPVSPTPAVVDVRDLIGKACGLGPGQKLAADSALDSIGIDSLLMIELHSDLSSALGVSIPHDALAECETIGDIESVISSLGYTGSNATTSSDNATGSTSPNSADSASSASSSTGASPYTPATTSTTPGTGGAKAASMTEIIANVCGADPSTISPDSELKSLGIDSLMTLELEDTLRGTYGVDISSLGVQHCRTVADVAKLVRDRSGY